MHRKSFIISFEGIEGSGKSTCASLLFNFLKKNLNNLPKKFKNVFLFREPGSTALGENLRNLLLNFLTPNIHKKTMAFLFEASRSYLFEENKEIFLENNIIIFDRFIDSTIAYQGYGLGLDINFLEKLNLFATDKIEPDLTFLLDVDIKVSLERIKSKKKDNIENMSIEFFKKVRHGFLEIAKKKSKRIIVIDGNRELKKVFENIKNLTLQKIKKI
ncbi:MAG TPA: dTMP kinase [Desulfurobacteriaceae bacterium]|nr:dTMP kinase [Desulfurobacteriaceae bacterium]